MYMMWHFQYKKFTSSDILPLGCKQLSPLLAWGVKVKNVELTLQLMKLKRTEESKNIRVYAPINSFYNLISYKILVQDIAAE